VLHFTKGGSLSVFSRKWHGIFLHIAVISQGLIPFILRSSDLIVQEDKYCALDCLRFMVYVPTGLLVSKKIYDFCMGPFVNRSVSKQKNL
jgi:hypothetical protein